MAVISVCSSKGGVGKTTAVICIADELARRGYSVAIVDADPNRHVEAWSEIAGEATSVKVYPGATHVTIQDMIANASERHEVVLVDLEGAATEAVTWAVTDSDMVLMPTRTSGMDLQELYRTYHLVKRVERGMGKTKNARALFTQIPPLANRITSHARAQVEAEGIKVLNTEIVARPNGYGGLHFTGVTPAHPDGDEKARVEIKAVADEIVQILSGQGS